MDILFSLFSFSFIASFTPGPNNLLVMSQGINHGLRSTYAYQLVFIFRPEKKAHPYNYKDESRQ